MGIVSVVLGLISLAATLAATYGESLRGVGSGFLLNFLDRVGLISPPSGHGESEMKVPSLLSLTDETALIGFLSYGIYLAVVAMALALWAEAKGEDTLYLSVGFILGAAAIVCFSFVYGLSAIGVGAIAFFLVRRVKRV